MIKSNKANDSLFLDRDGVINELLPGEYVRSVDSFKFKAGVLPEISKLSKIFKNIFIITNQQGIGKGLMSIEDLESIHQWMLSEIQKSGGKITKIYLCPHLKESNCDCRKPKPGMILKAFQEFSEIIPQNCYFIGDTDTDMSAAMQAGITPVAFLDSNNNIDNWNVKPRYLIHQLEEFRWNILPLV